VNLSIICDRFRRSRNVGRVAVIPGVAIVGEVIEGNHAEDQRERRYAHSSGRGHGEELLGEK
jgi:hypothetical protein